MLFNLNEDNPKLREEIYLFFAATTVGQGALFQKIIDKLFTNLIKFEHQGETDKIFTLCNQLGKSHSRLVDSIYLKVLNIDKRFLAKEPDWTDLVYVAKMILIYAAAESQKRILEDAPSFFSKHLTYFKDKYPCYFQTQPTEPVNDSLLQLAETKMLARIQSLFASHAGRAQVLVLTNNSFAQLSTESNTDQASRRLAEIKANKVDQRLGFIYLFTKFIQLCESNSPLLAISAQYKLMSHFEPTAEVESLIQKWLVLPLTKLVIAELQDATDAFNQKTFIDKCHSLASFATG